MNSITWLIQLHSSNSSLEFSFVGKEQAWQRWTEQASSLQSSWPQPRPGWCEGCRAGRRSENPGVGGSNVGRPNLPLLVGIGLNNLPKECPLAIPIPPALGWSLVGKNCKHFFFSSLPILLSMTKQGRLLHTTLIKVIEWNSCGELISLNSTV